MVILLAGWTATAMAAAPEWEGRLTADKPAGLPPLAPTELTYSLSWRGMVEAGKFTLKLGKKDPSYPGFYVASAVGSSKGVAATLFPYEFSFTSLLDSRTRQPLKFIANEKDRDGTVVTTAVFTRTGVNSSEVETLAGSTTSKTQTRALSYPDVRDLFSTLLFVRSQKLDPGDSVVVVSHPTNRGQLITVRVLGREKAAGQNAIKLSVEMERIQEDLTLKPYTKMKSATLWLSDDANRLPLELRAEVFIGDVRMTLKSWSMER
jgi:hypothetical protein